MGVRLEILMLPFLALLAGKVTAWQGVSVPAAGDSGQGCPLFAVPEPGMLVLVGSGLLALAILGRRQRR